MFEPNHKYNLRKTNTFGCDKIAFFFCVTKDKKIWNFLSPEYDCTQTALDPHDLPAKSNSQPESLSWVSVHTA